MCLCIISINSIDAASVTVTPGHSIQNAVNSAHTGDTVVVTDNNNKAYTYKESVYITKKLNIVSKGSVTIKAKSTKDAVFTINPAAAGSSIKDFKLSSSSYCVVVNGASGCTIYGNYISSASLVGIQFYGDITKSKVLNNKISGTTWKQGNGISFEYGKSTNNLINGNTVGNFLNGILFNSYSAGNTVSNNRVINTAYHGAGIYFTDNSNHNTIANNKVTGAEDGIAIQQMGNSIASYFNIKSNTLEYNKNGFWIKLCKSTIAYNFAKYNKVSGLDITGSDNKIVHNTATRNGNCGITLGKFTSTDNNLVQSNTLTYNRAGINSASSYTTICDNTILHNTSNGIISTANYCTIRNNAVGYTARKLIVQGTSNKVS